MAQLKTEFSFCFGASSVYARLFCACVVRVDSFCLVYTQRALLNLSAVHVSSNFAAARDLAAWIMIAENFIKSTCIIIEHDEFEKY
jgi:hypothetical protein